MEVHVRKGNYLLDFGFKKGHQILTFDGKHTLKIMFKKTLKLDFFLKRHNFLIDFEYLRHFRNIFVNKQIMFVTNFGDSEVQVYTVYCWRFLKSKEFGSTTHFASFQKYFENKQIMFVTNLHDSEDKCIQFTVKIFQIQGVWFYHTFCFVSKIFRK